MSRVLVTGANGFVGRRVTRVLLDRGYQVVAAVRSPEAGEQVAAGAGLAVVGDVEKATWSSALESVDFVVHLAAHVHRLNETDKGDPRYHEVNVAGTERLAAAAAMAGVERMVFLSSVKAVGESYSAPERSYTENDPCLPQDAYGRSKRDAEELLRQITGTRRLSVTVLRPPMVYGPGVKANFLSLLRAADRGLPLPLASVRNRRSLLFVDNLADAIERCLRPDENRQPFEVFFVADEESVSTPELITRLARALKRTNRLVPFPVWLMRKAARVLGKQGLIDRLAGSLVIDTSRIQATLGWRPPFSLDHGLAETAAWYREVYATGRSVRVERSPRGVDVP